METQYIISPQETAYPIALKGKVPRIKPAKRNEVPVDYRKLSKLEPIISEILLNIIGLAETIRKGIMTWIP